MRLIASLTLALLVAPSAQAQEEKKNSWEFFDYGEESGWSNVNDAGNIIAIHSCTRKPGADSAVFRATGFMDKYAQGKSGEYFVTALVAEFEDNVFSAPSEYFGTEFMFETRLPKDLEKATLKICARASSGTPPDPECNEFKGPGFSKMIADLCQ